MAARYVEGKDGSSEHKNRRHRHGDLAADDAGATPQRELEEEEPKGDPRACQKMIKAMHVSRRERGFLKAARIDDRPINHDRPDVRDDALALIVEARGLPADSPLRRAPAARSEDRRLFKVGSQFLTPRELEAAIEMADAQLRKRRAR